MTVISTKTQQTWIEKLEQDEGIMHSIEEIADEYDLTAPQAYNILHLLKNNPAIKGCLRMCDGRNRFI